MNRRTPAIPAPPANAVGPPDVMTIKEAATLLGVSEATLRRWDRAKKFSPHRHPISGFRLYRRKDVLALRGRIESGKAA